ncbi:MAG: glycosyltransferase [Candidatus Babeliales bacterium]|jgi:glycosyltransferase involved in cell wall biosynthesis
MNILHLITSLKVGGAESALVNYLSKVVDKDGNTHSVAYFHHGPNAKKIEDLGINIYKIPRFFFTYDLCSFWCLKNIVKLVCPDVIHSSLWSSNIIARLISKIYKIPVICDLHGNSFDEGRLRNWFDRRTVNYCAKIVAVSDSVKDSYLKNIIGSKNLTDACNYNNECRKMRANANSKLVVIKNGIDVQALRDKAFKDPLTRKDFGFSDNDFVIGAVGRLEPIKSYDVLIKAFALLTSFCHSEPDPGSKNKLCIVGAGSQRIQLETLVKALKIEEHVVFTGFRSDAYKFYPIFDCFALSSQSEGLSIALLEAMAFGLPVISTNLDISSHDVITPEVNGFLVYPNDIEGYALAINKLFKDHQNGQPLRRDINKRNLELVRTEFCIDGVVDKYQQLYQTVVGGSSCGKRKF